MKQVLQSLKTGAVELADVPAPRADFNEIVIQTSYSLVSLGTEKMLLEFGKAGWLGKARQQPDKVRDVFRKIKTDGVGATVRAVKSKLDRPIPLGYCNVGRVIEVGEGVTEFRIGDRVASNGPHAEVVCVPTHLCAKIPDEVEDREAAFTFVSAIALQGVRLLEPTLGDQVVVLGLGLIGLLGVQILRANGCSVIGFDHDEKKVQLAREFGAKAFVLSEGLNPVQLVSEMTGGYGCDSVLITAATASNTPVRMAPQMCRQRGRVSLVGVCDLDLSREDFYKKEISFQVSCSYGPGRYDSAYLVKDMDYPIGFVRWTVERNLQAILRLMGDGQVQCRQLISEVVPFLAAPETYEQRLQQRDTLGLLFKYDSTTTPELTIRLREAPRPVPGDARPTVIGIIGAGNFVGSTILPAIQKLPITLKAICSKNGVSAQNWGKRFGFEVATSDPDQIWNNPSINTVLIATPHDQHAGQILAALASGKHVFVEKPLAISGQQIERLDEALHVLGSHQQFLLGFNRRFAPLTQTLKHWLGPSPSGLAMVMNVNAGSVDRTHWTQDHDIGGGRLIGEGCHFVDLLRYLADSPIVDGRTCFADTAARDVFSIHLKFQSGAVGVINYFANGHRDLPKERLEVFWQNQVVLMDNFKSLTPFGAKGIKKVSRYQQDKGHVEQFTQFFQRIQQGGAPLIPVKEVLEVARWCIRLDGGS